MLYWPIRNRSAPLFCLKAWGFLGEEDCTSLWLHWHGGVFLHFPGTIKKRSRRSQTTLTGHWKKVLDFLIVLHSYLWNVWVIYSYVCVTPSLSFSFPHTLIFLYRLLCAMDVTSSDTEVIMGIKYFYFLACKPANEWFSLNLHLNKYD